MRHFPVRGRQLRRVLLVIDLLAPLRNGATVDAISRDYNELSGAPVCTRTIRRDLDVLESLGLVERVLNLITGERYWRWRDHRAVAHALRLKAQEEAFADQPDDHFEVEFADDEWDIPETEWSLDDRVELTDMPPEPPAEEPVADPGELSESQLRVLKMVEAGS